MTTSTKFVNNVAVLMPLLFLMVVDNHADYQSTYCGKSDDEKWNTYKDYLKKCYANSEDDDTRKLHFLHVDKMIQTNNNNINSSFKMDHNLFSDFNSAEKKTRLGVKDFSSSLATFTIGLFSRNETYKKFDLRQRGRLKAPVKDQGNCASSWIFAAVAVLESHTSFSEQQILDCYPKKDVCDGGTPDEAFSYIMKSRGLMSTADYMQTPDKNGTNDRCKFTQNSKVRARIKNVKYSSYNGFDMEWAIVIFTGAVPVFMTVVDNFYYYKSGVYSDQNCTSNQMPINHAVNLIGWNKLSTPYYWIVRNSWGPNWGNEGYFWIQRGVNMCKIETHIYFPVQEYTFTGTVAKDPFGFNPRRHKKPLN